MIAFTVQKIKVSSGANAEKRDNENGSQNWGGKGGGRKERRWFLTKRHSETGDAVSGQLNRVDTKVRETGARMSSCLLGHVLRLYFVSVSI